MTLSTLMSMFNSLILARLKLRLVDPIVTAAGVVKGRDITLVGIERDGVIGWGEAAPYPNYSTETIDDVWTALGSSADEILTWTIPGMPMTAAAAVDQARWDLAARLAGEPLWAAIGGIARPIACRVAVSGQTIDALLDKVQNAVASGIPAVKVKIMPGRDVSFVKAVVEAYPHLGVAVDANGSFDHTAVDVFDGLDALELDFFEQPLPRDDLRGHAKLRHRLNVPVALDESLHSPTAIARAIELQAADLLTVKVGIVGIAGVLEINHQLRASSMAIRLSGLIESSVGRAHTIALTTIGDMGPTDLAPTSFYLEGDSAHPSWTSERGAIIPRPDPGIGVTVDVEELEHIAVAWGRFTRG
jgi:o-succinylbenzoate synthase